ncbi:hypothetical protein GUJ93_ZPchr0011g28169 [Zizania palustris]|uniref:Aminotransferase-like plant mobile domain-containing protein n=1 Tax=Zizania palustris TaxID=103762 RepID=A0A8J5WI74_ZIZPA|nr:hypothetical protein GUJ93_ZPchr0011g28169 [Zizania palustris]
MLAPCSKEYVSSRYCGIVSNVEELKRYNWAQFTLDFLINHLELFKTSKRTGLVGNLAFLQIWYFEHFQVADDCFDYGLHKRPLIASWGANKVAKCAQLEGVKKSGCAKVVIRLEADDGKVVTLSNNSECSCGIFTIKYMQYWDGEKMTSNFSQDDMETFRKKMPAELILCPLNEYDFVKDDVSGMSGMV